MTNTAQESPPDPGTARTSARRAGLSIQSSLLIMLLLVSLLSSVVVGLIGYLAKGVSLSGHALKPEYVTAACVPVVVFVVWWMVRRIRRAHGEHD